MKRFTERPQGEQFAILASAGFLGFFAFFVWLSTGQASIFDTQWTKVRAAAEKPYEYYIVVDPDRLCRQLGATDAGRIQGCANIQGVRCRIFTTPRPPRDLLEHEEKHCEGYDHP